MQGEIRLIAVNAASPFLDCCRDLHALRVLQKCCCVCSSTTTPTSGPALVHGASSLYQPQRFSRVDTVPRGFVQPSIGSGFWKAAHSALAAVNTRNSCRGAIDTHIALSAQHTAAVAPNRSRVLKYTHNTFNLYTIRCIGISSLACFLQQQ